MKLNQGSLINCILDNTKATEPIIGMGGTLGGWSDRHACTVTKFHKTASGKLVVEVQQDTATLVAGSGLSEKQVYDFTPNPKGRVLTFLERKDGVLREKGGSYSLTLGHRSEYYDPCF